MAKKDATSKSAHVRYHRLRRTDDGFVDLQFQKPTPKIPWRAISLAVFLFVLGTVIIIVSSLILTGYISEKPTDGTWVLLILGILMFVPGIYHVRIAYYAYKLYPGYSFDDIPDFD